MGEKVVETFAEPDRLIYRAENPEGGPRRASNHSTRSPQPKVLGAHRGKMTQKFAPDGEETGEDVDVRRFRVKKEDRDQVPLQEACRDGPRSCMKKVVRMLRKMKTCKEY